MSIAVLPPEVASRIAAGEVVERPASIVKELVENSLDAGATRISVEAADGGGALIRVTDNGCGIDPEELVLAFSRHATSKLRDDREIEAVTTLGFRGEALPSIAAVADVEAISRTVEEPTAGRAHFRFGELVDQGARGAPAGTTISVRLLFQQQPARLKFLKSKGSEAGQIASVVSHYALAYPEVAFSLRQDGRETFATAGQGSLREAAANVYGPDLGAALIEAGDESEEHWLAALVAPPSHSRSSRSYITIFINRRWVRSRSLSFAVEEAYQGLLQVRRFPLAIVDLRLPPQEVDVNVHPAKTEVRLRNERQVFTYVQKPIRSALSGLAPVGSGPVVGWPRTEGILAPGTSSTAAANPTPFPAPPLLIRPDDAPAAETTAQSTSGTQPALPAALPVLRPLGQAGTTYIIAEGPTGLYLVDQHAAHERVVFERISAQRSTKNATPTQALLSPIAVDLTPTQQSLVSTYAEALKDYGFEIESFGPGDYLLRAAPPDLRREDPARALAELLDLLNRDDAPADPNTRVAASMACHAAIRAGQALTTDEMRDLLRQLEACELPQTCPHGRPTMLHLSSDELARRFSRR